MLLDLRLPDGRGWRCSSGIRAIDARIPVIFITMAKTADTAIEAMKHGAFDYLLKPLDLEQLRRVVGEALEVARHALAGRARPTPRRSPKIDGAICRQLPGDARGLQGDRPRRRRRT